MPFTYRQNEIINYLKEKKHARISDISKHIFVSDATIRRELTELEKLGLVKRDHGGAVILESADEISIYVRQKLGTDEKESTSQIAAGRLPEFKTVFIDNSSTALIYSSRINFAYKTVVTNGLMLAMQLSSKPDVHVIVLGGNLDYNTTSMTGYTAINTLREMHFDLSICSCTSLSEYGSFESSIDQCEIKRTAMKNSKKRVLIADRTKFQGNAMYHTATLTDYDAVFTNADDETVSSVREKTGANIINK